MNVSPTLSVQEFADVHNAKCELYSIMQSVEGVVHPSLTERLQKALLLMEKGLKSAYEQDDAAYEKASRHFDEVSREFDMKTIWSMYEVKDLRAAHPWPDHKMISYSEHSGHGEVKVAIQGPTWADLWIAADKAVRASGDTHHIFIENFTQSKTREFELCLSTGS